MPYTWRQGKLMPYMLPSGGRGNLYCTFRQVTILTLTLLLLLLLLQGLLLEELNRLVRDYIIFLTFLTLCVMFCHKQQKTGYQVLNAINEWTYKTVIFLHAVIHSHMNCISSPKTCPLFTSIASWRNWWAGIANRRINHACTLHKMVYSANRDSISGSKAHGLVFGPYRPCTVPSFLTKNLAKFHAMSPVSPLATLR